VFFGFETERVHVNTLFGHILMMLIWLDKIEVTTIALGEAVMTVELEFSGSNGVGTVFEGYWKVYTVGTTSSNTWHRTNRGVRVVDKDVGGSEGEGTGSDVGHIVVIGVVEPLFTVVGTSGGIGNMGVGLYYPHKFLHWVVEVEFHLIGCRGCALITGELELFNEVFVGHLGEPAAFIGIKVDVVDEQRGGAKRAGYNSGLAGGNIGVIPSTGEVAVSEFTEFKVDLDFVVLYLTTFSFKKGVDYVLKFCINKTP